MTLKCDSSKKRRRGRKSPSKEVSHITAEFEVETRMEEASGGRGPEGGRCAVLGAAGVELEQRGRGSACSQDGQSRAQGEAGLWWAGGNEQLRPGRTCVQHEPGPGAQTVFPALGTLPTTRRWGDHVWQGHEKKRRGAEVPPKAKAQAAFPGEAPSESELEIEVHSSERSGEKWQGMACGQREQNRRRLRAQSLLCPGSHE